MLSAPRLSATDRDIMIKHLVIRRQYSRPANNTVPITKETGFVNVIIWQRVFEQYKLLAKSASFLGITGTSQYETDVVHIIAEQLWLPQEEIPKHRSRDFH